MKLSKLAELIGATIKGDANIEIVGVASLDSATNKQVTFLNNKRFLRSLLDTKAAAVVIDKSLENSNFATGLNLLLVDDPDAAFDKVVMQFLPAPPEYPQGISEFACVSEDAEISASAYIGPMCVVESGAKIGERTVLVSGVYIGLGSEVGEDCLIYSNSVVRERCKIGNRVILHPCCVIGADGFGFVFRNGKQEKVPQRGTVVIGDDVEIGACSCIDRARFTSTRIGNGAKIDNLVQIAHNVTIGKSTVLAAQVGIAGSSSVGNYVMMGGRSGVSDHCNVGDKAIILGMSVTTKDVPPGTVVGGFPAKLHSEFVKQEISVRRLPALGLKVNKLEERLRKLEAQVENNKQKS